ncbi:MAG: glycine--tRNA ligase subunit beta [Geminicoccaceae bacterium]
MPDFLLELFSEEIPARMQIPAAQALARGFRERLADRQVRLAEDQCTALVTPRRLTLIATVLPIHPPLREVQRRGPRVDAPEKAISGFRKSLETINHRIEEIDEKKGRFLVAIYRDGGAPMNALLTEIVEESLAQFPWPKSMRWGLGKARWVRPLKNILCLQDDTILPVQFAGLQANDKTFGHRFMAPSPIQVTGIEPYREELRRASVVIDTSEREAIIWRDAQRLIEEAGLVLMEDGPLLQEVAGLVEWPVPLLGQIDQDFMSLPREVLITSMREHQKYFATETVTGELASAFVTVANLVSADGGAAIIAGNERVLRARLWDARFFWEQDQTNRLEDREEQLSSMVFHAKLGSLADKARRIEKLAGWLCRFIPGAHPNDAERAGKLAKMDLVTGMVGEFPELQGVMGGYYARAQGESEAVAQAITEHYRPAGAGDICPTAPVSVAVALADKLDSLVGLVAVGERATGSKDPLALRRTALGIIRLITENRLRLSLTEAMRFARERYGDLIGEETAQSDADYLKTFFLDRLRVHWREEGVSHDVIEAATATEKWDDIVMLRAKLEALRGFLASDDGANLLAAYRRARNIVSIEQKRDQGHAPTNGELNAELLHDGAELALYGAIDSALPHLNQQLREEDFEGAMNSLAALRPSVDPFYDEVLVKTDDAALRRNRLILLARIASALDSVADFTRIEDKRPTST